MGGAPRDDEAAAAAKEATREHVARMASTIAMRVEADARIGAHAAAHERRVNDFVGGAKEAGLLRLIKGLTSRNLRHLAEIFDAADHDRDTALNFREFRLALTLLIDATDAHDAEALAPPPLREARVLFEQLDADSSGLVEFNEFARRFGGVHVGKSAAAAAAGPTDGGGGGGGGVEGARAELAAAFAFGGAAPGTDEVRADVSILPVDADYQSVLVRKAKSLKDESNDDYIAAATNAELEQAAALFARHDCDGDGFLSFHDLQLLMIRLRERGVRTPVPPHDTRALREVFELADLDHNGLLDFNEFVGLQVRSRARELERHAAELGQRATRGMPTHAELYARATRRKSRVS